MFWSPKKQDTPAATSSAEDFDVGAPADEATPLIGDSESSSASKVQFRRRSARYESVRGSVAIQGLQDEDEPFVQPVDALAPLVRGGVIVCTDGYKTSHPASSVKSLPAYVPFRRMARHRNFYLWWTNEFRHWWKSSRLLVRLAGLYTLAVSLDFVEKMVLIEPYMKRHKAVEKNSYRALRVVKKLGQGGPMRLFLENAHFFTRSLRILVGAWRWVESAQCRRLEVGVEETMAFIGNRVSRMVSRSLVDLLVLQIVMPVVAILFRYILPHSAWHPAALFITLGILRACAPYAASFQGSRFGRFLTREYFKASKHRWRPIQRVEELNLLSDDCCEKDEISDTADLAKLAKLVAKALGTGQKIGLDGMKGQTEALAKQGFKQIGAGSGGYAVYECHRRVYRGDTTGNLMTIMLHVTPFGPSILDVMPRYVVLEFEDSVDRRAKWSEYISKKVFVGPPVLEGYVYEGAFFSPHHFAALKVRYDKELTTYDFACKALVKKDRNPNPPTDLRSLKAFLVAGKRGRKQKRNAREYRKLQASVAKVTNELKAMMNLNNSKKDCCAPRGVILYFEGLDCSGKSSTGGLVEQALRNAGYNVELRQHNRPPTAAQKAKPWMDQDRFELPSTIVAVAVKSGGADDDDSDDLMKKCVGHAHNAMTWDRGPLGDFVYGALGSASDEEKKKHYQEFLDAEKAMFDKGILFSKMLFVTNRDSIASTLGKRLAQVQMARDLKTWLQASRGGDNDYGDIGFEGLDEIFLHIDPTDFVAFNMYQRNLRIFTNAAFNTDSEENPWLVVNTSDRYAARQQLLRAFSVQLQRFKTRKTCCGCCPQRDTVGMEEEPRTSALSEAEMLQKGFVKPWPTSILLSLIGILLLIFYYCEHTNFDSLVYWVSGEAFKMEHDE